MKTYKKSIFIIIFWLLFFGLSHNVQAASLSIVPSSGTYSVGSSFKVAVKINTEQNNINAGEGTLSFNPNELSVVSISKTGSIFNFWVQDPEFSNLQGTIDFSGIVFNPGYIGSSGTVVTITFKAKAKAESKLSFSSGAILANDGTGTNLLASLNGASFTLQSTASIPTTSPSPTPVSPEVVVDNLLSITSSTHPDSIKWYSNNDPDFAWSMPTDATGVSYLITDKATSNPGSKSDGVENKVSFTDIADGNQYFHIKLRQNGIWGTITHYQFNIDTAPPTEFDIKNITTDPIHPEITFETTDTLSGIEHYEIKIGDNGSWTVISSDEAGKPYRISFDQIGTQTVYVKAVDKAGNTTTKSIPVTISGTAVGTTIGTWVSRFFNGFVNAISNYGLIFLGIAGIIGLLILIYRLLGVGIDKLWHRIDNRRVIRKTEHKIDSKFNHILEDMKEEVKFIETIAKRRPLGPEEKYLKSKLQQYIKGLKNGGR